MYEEYTLTFFALLYNPSRSESTIPRDEEARAADINRRVRRLAPQAEEISAKGSKVVKFRLSSRYWDVLQEIFLSLEELPNTYVLILYINEVLTLLI